MKPVRLGLNVDHVATLRNARGGTHPDPVSAARQAIEYGADSITVHLREDRRHIRDDDVLRLIEERETPLNFEMAATDEMIKFCQKIKPHACCIVPEKREERTTEGGLDVTSDPEKIRQIVAACQESGARISLFLEPDSKALEIAAKVNAPVVELHTGSWCDAIANQDKDSAHHHFQRLQNAARIGHELGLEMHAGHGLNFITAEQISKFPQIRELNIGHFLIGEAVYSGLQTVIEKMLASIENGVSKRD